MKIAGVAGLACMALAVALVAQWRNEAGDGREQPVARGERSGSVVNAKVRNEPSVAPMIPKRPGRGGASRIEQRSDDDMLTPADKSLASRIEKALDDMDFAAVSACAETAQKCGAAEVRQSAVEALGQFDEKALPELTPFLADEDEDVRECAKTRWTVALSCIEDDGAKIHAVELAMQVLKDEGVLEDISGEYIGVDEKLAVESLARIIEAGGSECGVAKAKETYEFVTGEEWTGVEEARRWIVEEYKSAK